MLVFVVVVVVVVVDVVVVVVVAIHSAFPKRMIYYLCRSHPRSLPTSDCPSHEEQLRVQLSLNATTRGQRGC